MATSIRELIIQNLQTAIKQVKRKNDYENDIESALVYRATNAVNTTMFPSVYIFEGDERVEEREVGSDPFVIKEMDVTVEFWMKEFENLATKVNSLEADITKAIMEDCTRGGYAMGQDVDSSIPFFQEEQNVGGRILTFSIRYVVKEIDPYTGG